MPRGRAPRRTRFTADRKRRTAKNRVLKTLRRFRKIAYVYYYDYKVSYDRFIEDVKRKHRERVKYWKKKRVIVRIGVAVGKVVKPLAEVMAIVMEIATNLADHIYCRTSKLHYRLATVSDWLYRRAYIAVAKVKTPKFVRAVVDRFNWQTVIKHLKTWSAKPLGEIWTTVALIAETLTERWASRLRPLYDAFSWLLSPFQAVLEIAYSVGEPERVYRGDFRPCSPYVYDVESRPVLPNFWNDMNKLRGSIVREFLGDAERWEREYKSIAAVMALKPCDPIIGKHLPKCYEYAVKRYATAIYNDLRFGDIVQLLLE